MADVIVDKKVEFNCQAHREPGHQAEAYHLPGYTGHVPSMSYSCEKTFGQNSTDAMEDPTSARANDPHLLSPRYACFVPGKIPNDPNVAFEAGPTEKTIRFVSNPAWLQDKEIVGAIAPALDEGALPVVILTAEQLDALKEPLTEFATKFRSPMNEFMMNHCQLRAHHLNLGPNSCPCFPEIDDDIFRCSESRGVGYPGHLKGFTTHSDSCTFGKGTWSVKQYLPIFPAGHIR